MIYDCFTFFNELDLLEIRLNILNDVVDKFIIVESKLTFNNTQKPLYFEDNKERFAKFKDKIIHIVADNYPEFESAWVYENHQRNAILLGLKECTENDTILISDLDEIPKPEMILKHVNSNKIILFEMNMFYYYANMVNISEREWNYGTKMLKYKFFSKELPASSYSYSLHLPEKYNQGTTANKIRHYKCAKRLKNAGWHFSYLGGVDAIIKKIHSFSHQEFNSEEYANPAFIEQAIEDGRDIFKRDFYYTAIPLDDTFPKFLLENKDKYAHLFFTKKYYSRPIPKDSYAQKCMRIFLTALYHITPIGKIRRKMRNKYKFLRR